MAARFRNVLPVWCLLFLCALCVLPRPDALAQPKREFRAAWIATVSNIDWPSRPGLSADQQRAEFVKILTQHQQAGLNAVVVQVRSACDALYPSAFEPWADVLTGRQGQAPDYDPLAFMIAECHKRGLEFHAWFNPYRAVANTQVGTLHAAHIARKRPDWLLAQGTLRILNPGLPAVRNYVAGVIMDVVRRYDIDGVHFDDYFYPYPPGPGTLPFNDDATFAANKRGFTNRAAWRRDNVNLFIKQMADSLQATKPWVKFGVSPFGIWQNKSAAQPLGSTSRGLQSYSDIYADSRQWIQAGWLDYVAPQLYWNSKQTSANYGQLVPWWSAVVQSSPATAGVNRHLYIGQAAYRVGAAGESATWNVAGHMPDQLRLNRSTVAVQGSIFYNTSTFNRNPLGLRDSLRTAAFYGRPALRPAMPWKHNTPLPAPTQLQAERQGSWVALHWEKPSTVADELNRIRQFAVYRFIDGQVVSTEDPTALLAITATDTTDFVDANVPEGRTVRYLVTALNRLHSESPASNVAVASAGADDEPAGFDLRLSPNPVSERVVIDYDLPAECTVRLGIRDTSGRAITQLPEQRQSAGTYSILFRPTQLPSGVYFVVLQANGHELSRRMLVAH
ncbi:FenI protein [Fibrella aestuarina BUZ 2]|uniref:FenI protein n=1 Tax=Fibrella aestuarina BUZ 2 TaxID=1166018 RepID=I0K9I2_9BACT|nr:family 10 glycosylhydrolase [Fibrella aestuarina]CCH00785.1 FenI protein [Fibrella aestuarina BUZ 2]